MFSLLWPFYYEALAADISSLFNILYVIWKLHFPTKHGKWRDLNFIVLLPFISFESVDSSLLFFLEEVKSMPLNIFKTNLKMIHLICGGISIAFAKVKLNFKKKRITVIQAIILLICWIYRKKSKSVGNYFSLYFLLFLKESFKIVLFLILISF